MPLKPRELTTPEKVAFQQAIPLLRRQTHRAEFQQKSQPGLFPNNQHQRRKPQITSRPKPESRTKKN
ncbi:hypothetical protein CGI09_24390 [Vibrio parahaemolyticus]|nr:hypothetical protein CGI71_23470 [Vibrio parahaemolyticus]TOK99613.1 hypothetical protein CGI09_24390 [Vibrio parahaemolyticus]TOP84834.1 hypothetical protein CGH08_18940 [Vibrio parahaemolyticus]TOQ21296.1 hypothetical protein CGG99_23635 [Vibrio parahaemolyticus]